MKHLSKIKANFLSQLKTFLENQQYIVVGSFKA